MAQVDGSLTARPEEIVGSPAEGARAGLPYLRIATSLHNQHQNTGLLVHQSHDTFNQNNLTRDARPALSGRSVKS